MSFRDVQVGTTLTRMLAGTVPIAVDVVEVTDKLIVVSIPGETKETAGSLLWTFDRDHGFEIDPDLGWGEIRDGQVLTGSYLMPPEQT